MRKGNQFIQMTGLVAIFLMSAAVRADAEGLRNPVELLVIAGGSERVALHLSDSKSGEFFMQSLSTSGGYRRVLIQKRTEKTSPGGMSIAFDLRVQDALGRNTAFATFYPLNANREGSCVRDTQIEGDFYCARSGVLILDSVEFSFWGNR